MNNELVAVIIPFYNVERYIDRCLASVVNQTYKNLEIIIVDDGSQDKSINIVNDYINRFNNIILIQKENGGISSARNKALDIANGNYIVFIDSDDYIEDNMIEKLYTDLLNTSSDISICNYFLEGSKTTINTPYKKRIVDRKSVV